MKEQTQQPGVRKWAGDDMIALQAEPLSAIQGFFKEYGNCIIQGCETTAAGGKFNIAPGLLGLAGVDAAGEATFKVVPFSGVENVTLPLYFTLTHSVIDRVYGDGKVKPIVYDYRAAVAAVKPAAGVEFLELTSAGGRRFVDAVKITEKLDKTGNGKDVSVTFSEATTRENIASGEKLSSLFGKVRKWFAGLATVAFTGKAADLTQDAGNRLVTDAEKAGWNDKYAKAQTYTRAEIDQRDAALQGEIDGKLPADGGSISDFISPFSKFGVKYWTASGQNTPTAYGMAFDFGMQNQSWLYRLAFPTNMSDILYYSRINDGNMQLVGKLWHSGNFNPIELQSGLTGKVDKSIHLGEANLNDITDPGFYYQDGDVQATTERNYPTHEAGSLIVMKSANVNTNRRNQIYQSYVSNRIFTSSTQGVKPTAPAPRVKIRLLT